MRYLGVIALAATLLAGVRVGDAAGSGSPEDFLASKGLVKTGTLWLAKGELQMRDGLRTMRMAKKKLDDSTAHRIQLEKQIRQADDAISAMAARDQEISNQMDQARGVPFKYNQLVGQSNALHAQMHDATRFQDDRRKEIAKLADPRDEYVMAVMDLSDKMEAVARQYQVLAADPDVTAAIAKLNEKGGPKFKLGPSLAFTQELPGVRRERAGVNTAAIKFNNQAHVPEVDVMLNGKVTISMILDSGASEVCLSWDVAQRLGITPDANDPVVTTIIANGKKVGSYSKVLDSVRLGPFTAEKVACLISPKSEQGAPNLLGGTFLQNFVYKMDLANGEVRMSQIGGRANPADLKSALAGPTPTVSSEASGSGVSPRSPVAPVPLNPPASAKGLPPQDEKIVENGWTVLFRSAYPGHWDSPVHDSRSYAVEFDQAPKDMRYLRMRNAAGDFVIVPLNFEQLETGVMFETWGWEGRGYTKGHARHLGIFVKSLACTEPGSIDVTQADNNAGWTGYGFGSRVNLNDRQGFVWAGKPIEKGILEIAVTDRELTDAERQKLIGD